MHTGGQGRLLAKKKIVIETVMDEENSLPCPLFQIFGEGRARGNRAIRRVHRPSSERPLRRRVKQQPIISPVAQIAQEVGRGVESVPAKKYLWNRRVEKRKVSRRHQNLSCGAANEAWQVALFIQKSFARTGGTAYAHNSNAGRFRDLTAQCRIQQDGCAHVVPNRQARQNVADVSEPSACTGCEPVNEKVDHSSVRVHRFLDSAHAQPNGYSTFPTGRLETSRGGGFVESSNRDPRAPNKESGIPQRSISPRLPVPQQAGFS